MKSLDHAPKVIHARDKDSNTVEIRSNNSIGKGGSAMRFPRTKEGITNAARFVFRLWRRMRHGPEGRTIIITDMNVHQKTDVKLRKF